jgi:hypothetical protein
LAVVEGGFCRGFWQKQGAERGVFVVDCVVKRGAFTVAFWGGRMGHPFDIYFVRKFVLFDVSWGDSCMGTCFGDWRFEISNGVRQATT